MYVKFRPLSQNPQTFILADLFVLQALRMEKHDSEAAYRALVALGNIVCIFPYPFALGIELPTDNNASLL